MIDSGFESDRSMDRSNSIDNNSKLSSSSSVSSLSKIPPLSTFYSSNEQLQNRVDSLLQENHVLKIELDMYKLRLKSTLSNIENLKKSTFIKHLESEQEEEYRSNILFKQINELNLDIQNEKQQQQNTSMITSDKGQNQQLREDDVKKLLKQEQEELVVKLSSKIKYLEADMKQKQQQLDYLQHDKCNLENKLEQNEEKLVNKLIKQLNKLEIEKHLLQDKLNEKYGEPTTMSCSSCSSLIVDDSVPVPLITKRKDNQRRLKLEKFLNKTKIIQQEPQDTKEKQREDSVDNGNADELESEVERLKTEITDLLQIHRKHLEIHAKQECEMRAENMLLSRRLQYETDRRQSMYHSLSESEASLEINDEHFINTQDHRKNSLNSLYHQQQPYRNRTVSSPISDCSTAAVTMERSSSWQRGVTNSNDRRQSLIQPLHNAMDSNGSIHSLKK